MQNKNERSHLPFISSTGHRRSALLVAVVIVGCFYPSLLRGDSTITYVQGNYATPQSPERTVTVSFTKAQTAGDLNVVVVGWNGSSNTVSSVTDKSGNTYALAVGPTIVSGYLTQSIYYAKNVTAAAAGANVVTVEFASAANYPDIRILEYSGADPNNPVDVVAAATGKSSTSTSASATTSNATDLIFGANIVTTTTSGAGSGFTKRLLTSPDGDIAEDKMVKATGSYNAKAPLSSSGEWIMQMVAFRTPGVEAPSTPANLTATAESTSQINLSWTASTSSVGLANYIVERCEGSGCTNFSQVAAPTGTTYSDTGLAAGTSYSYEVQAEDEDGNLSVFSNVASATTPATVASTITYVQSNYATPQSADTTVTVPFTSAQTAGDLNVVVVGWNDSTATVSSVTDTSGNVYALAVGPTMVSGYLSQSIYYAKNVVTAAAGANAVSVSFSTAASDPDIRILEYSGADPNNPVDVASAATGNSTNSSAAASTTNSTDLIFGANIVTSTTSGPGAGFTQRLLTSPDGDIAEDEMATAAGSYTAAAPMSSGLWIMQMVAFRTPVGSGVSSDPGTLAASPTTVSFGSVAVGGTSSQTVVLSNTAGATVTVSQATVTGTGFAASGLSLPLTLSSGQSVSFSVTFAPTASGSVSGSLSLASNATDSTLAVILSGTGTTQTLSMSPATLSFGDVLIGSTSVLPVVATNTGTTSITLSQATISGTGFSFTGPSLPVTLASGQAASFSVTFAPTTGGNVTGSLSVVSTASNSPTSSSLSAAGVNQHSVALTWTASTTSGVTGYDVYRGTISGGPYTLLNSSPTSSTSYTDTTVEAGQTYYYVATAVNSSGVQSTDSNQVTAVVSFP